LPIFLIFKGFLITEREDMSNSSKFTNNNAGVFQLFIFIVPKQHRAKTLLILALLLMGGISLCAQHRDKKGFVGMGLGPSLLYTSITEIRELV
jgi:hypothetical protein